jgi:hypothetical protein
MHREARKRALELQVDYAPELRAFDDQMKQLKPAARLAAPASYWTEVALAIQIANDRGASIELQNIGGRYGSLERSIQSARNCARTADWAAAMASGRANGRISSPDMLKEIHSSALGNILESTRIGKFRTRGVRIHDPRIHKYVGEGTKPDLIEGAVATWSLCYSRANMADVHPLIRSGLAHLALNEIHPFPDGTGRSGRIMADAMHVESGLARLPFPIEFERERIPYCGAVTDALAAKDPKIYLAFHIARMTEAAYAANPLSEKLEKSIEGMTGAIQCAKVDPDAAKRIATSIACRPIATAAEIASASKVEERQSREALYNLERAGFNTRHSTVADISFFACYDTMSDLALEFARPKSRIPETEAPAPTPKRQDAAPAL